MKSCNQTHVDNSYVITPLHHIQLQWVSGFSPLAMATQYEPPGYVNLSIDLSYL